MQPEHLDTVEPSAELALVEHAPPSTLFGTSDPTVALARMSEIAKSLVDVVKTQRLYVRIGGKDHLYCEAWTCLGGMLGVHAIVTATRLNETGDGYIAHAEARTIRGELVGGADGECSRAESKWRDRDPFALRSMASTRAISRALRGPLGQIVVLAGYAPAAAEEIVEQPPAPSSSQPKLPPDTQPTPEQISELRELLETLTDLDAGVDWVNRCREIAGVPGDMLTRSGAAILLDKLHEIERELS
jgi:hypothetical protein